MSLEQVVYRAKAKATLVVVMVIATSSDGV